MHLSLWVAFGYWFCFNLRLSSFLYTLCVWTIARHVRVIEIFLKRSLLVGLFFWPGLLTLVLVEDLAFLSRLGLRLVCFLGCLLLLAVCRIFHFGLYPVSGNTS